MIGEGGVRVVFMIGEGGYGGPVGRGYEQRFESKNEYEQRSESKIAYGPRAKLRTV